MRLGHRGGALRLEIEACGYFPDLVEDTITLALADEELVDFVVHHEPTFNRDEIHRHVTVLALTPTRLLVGPHRRPPRRAAGHRHLRGRLDRVGVRCSKIDTVVLTRVVPAAGDVSRPGRSGSTRPG